MSEINWSQKYVFVDASAWKKSFILQFVIEHKLQNQTATCKIGILPLGILPRAEKRPKGIDSMTDFSQSSLQSM